MRRLSVKVCRTLKAKWSFQTFKRSLSDSFGHKCKSEVISIINTRVVLIIKPNFRFDLTYCSYALQILYI